MGFVSCGRPFGIWIPELGILAGRDDCGCATGGDGVVALAGDEGAIGSDAGDLLIGRDLVKQFGQGLRSFRSGHLCR